jgi:hypothetical protein
MIVAVTLTALASAASAADHFLTIGGGDGPSHNQVSLEKNVLYFQHVLSDFGVPAAAHDIFFSCGPEARRAVQYRAASVPKVNMLLADVLGNSDNVDLEYRKPVIRDLRGPATRKSLSDWFARVGSKLADDDRLFVYFTGHGGQGKPARNTTLTLWNENSMDVKEFTGLLDKLPPKVQVVMIMVQCHSGGFADVIFNNGQAGTNASALSDRHRCGFFATVPERQAAGCTPDINEENYHEYSTYFFEAICGQSRTGSRVDPPDYDGDGHVSFAEAHAYVQLHSDTIDIPVCTSEILLRSYSKTRMDGVDDLMTPEAPFDKLTASATAAQKAVLEGLSKQLEVYGLERTDAVQKETKRVQKEKQQADGDANRAMRDYRQAREPVASALRAKWPELNTRWHPRLAKILSDEADDVVRTIESHAGYGKMEKAGERAEAMNKKALDLDRRWAKCQRFLRVAEDVALSANLPKVASPEVVERYKELIAAEAGTLVGATPASPGRARAP